jgi:hypothetical protein
MPHLAMAAVEVLRLHIFEVAHQPRQVRTESVLHEVIVIAYQLVGQHLRVKVLYFLLHYAEQRRAIAVILENRFAAVAAEGDVVNRTRKVDSQGAGHRAKDRGKGGKRQDLSMDFADFGCCGTLPQKAPNKYCHSSL